MSDEKNKITIFRSNNESGQIAKRRKTYLNKLLLVLNDTDKEYIRTKIEAELGREEIISDLFELEMTMAMVRADARKAKTDKEFVRLMKLCNDLENEKIELENEIKNR